MADNISEYEIFLNKRTDRTYLGKSFDTTTIKPSITEGIEEIKRPTRIVSKVIDCKEDHKFIKEGKEVVLRITGGVRQEIKVKFYEDTRGILTLQIQRYSTDTGNPHNTNFTFIGDEIGKLFNFIKNVAVIPINSSGSKKIEDKDLQELSKEQTLKIISDNPEILSEVLKNDITHSDIVALGYRKEQLKIFHNLLIDSQYFNSIKAQNQIDKDEAVWQRFFEKNTWIFGYGLNYVFNSSLRDKKLEQYVAGYSAFSSGKRVDALMQTKGLISSLCFAEIKTHKTKLLEKEYREECFSISQELAGAISQIQKTVQKSIKEIKTKTELKDAGKNLTGESVFLYQPKAFIVVGSLGEFKTENGINEDKFSSFELFRRSISNPEIITFDELYERSRYIVEFTDRTTE